MSRERRVARYKAILDHKRPHALERPEVFSLPGLLRGGKKHAVWHERPEVVAMAEAKFNQALAATNIQAAHLHPELRANLLRLCGTKIIDDELAAATYFTDVGTYLETVSADNSGFSPADSTLVRQATLLSDSGKAGWLGASAEARQTMTQLHGEDRHFELEDTLGEYIDKFFSATDELQQKRLADDATTYSATDLKNNVAKMADQGIALDMPMRVFFHLHARWSYELIMASTLDDTAAVAAAAGLHHFLEKIVPFPIEYAATDINTLISRNVIWVIILDKYDAQIRRGNVEPTEAINWLHNFIEHDAGGGLGLIPDAQQRQLLEERFHSAIAELAGSLGLPSTTE